MEKDIEKKDKSVKKFCALRMKDEVQMKVQNETSKMSFQELHKYLTDGLKNNVFWQKLNTK